MKVLKFYILTAVLMVILVGVCLIPLELFLCWSSHRDSTEKRDHVVISEYLPVTFKPGYEGRMWNIPYSTNSYGFRDEPEFPEEPEIGELRVLSMGDSIGFGVGIEASEHYCKVAEERIRGSFVNHRLNIINASGQGYSPSGYYVYLRHEGLRLQPSMIIVEIELCNDLTDESLLRWKLTKNDPYPNAVKGGRYTVAWDGSLLGTYALGGYSVERTYTYTVFIRRMLNLLNKVSPSPLFTETPGGTVYYSLGFDSYLLDEARIEEGWQRLLSALSGIQELCSSNQIPFLLLIMPSRYIFDESVPHRDLARSLMQRAEMEIKRRKISYLNIGPSIETAGGSDLFFDFAHLTAEGNRAVGETLSGLVLDMMKTRQTPDWDQTR